MKSFAVALGIFILVFIGTGYYSHRLNEEIEHLESKLSDVRDSVTHEDWDKSKEKTNDLMADWDKAQNWLKAIVNHKEMDLIMQTLYEMKGYVDAENKEETLVKAGVLKVFLEHIPENEALTLNNIF